MKLSKYSDRSTLVWEGGRREYKNKSKENDMGNIVKGDTVKIVYSDNVICYPAIVERVAVDTGDLWYFRNPDNNMVIALNPNSSAFLYLLKDNTESNKTGA